MFKTLSFASEPQNAYDNEPKHFYGEDESST